MAFKQQYATRASINTMGLSGLANNSASTSAAVDNSTTKYDEIILEIKTGGTAAPTAWLDVRILASTDGGSTWSTPHTPYLILPAIDMSVDNPYYHTRFVPPEQFKIYVLNKTGAVLDVGKIFVQGVTYVSE